MTDRDDILRMAREAQWLGNIEGWTFNSYAELERFFKTAYEAGAAAERKACAKVFAAAIRARGHAQVADRLARHGIPFPGEENGRDPV